MISGEPTIARNIVTLTFRHLHVRIALVNSTSHFLVCINAGGMKKEKLHEACLEVRSTILEAIRDVTEMMQLDLQIPFVVLVRQHQNTQQRLIPNQPVLVLL